MFISRKYKFIFLHMPKTGGTSVRTALRNIDMKATHRECFLHSDVKYSKAFIERAGERWEDYFKFTIIRNPFARMVSFYNHMLRLGQWHKDRIKEYTEKRTAIIDWNIIYNCHENLSIENKKVKDLTGNIITDSQWLERYEYKDFEDFIKHPIYHMHKLNVRKLDFVTTFKEWLSDGDEIGVDYIMKLEECDKGWREVLKKIGVKYFKFPHLKVGQSVKWKDYYTDELREIVAERFKIDLEYFNYEF